MVSPAAPRESSCIHEDNRKSDTSLIEPGIGQLGTLFTTCTIKSAQVKVKGASLLAAAFVGVVVCHPATTPRNKGTRFVGKLYFLDLGPSIYLVGRDDVAR